MPLATVLVGMDRAFEQAPNVTSLAYCRRRVEELAAAGPAAGAAARPARGERAPRARWRRCWPPCSSSWRRCGPRAGASFEPPLRKIREVQDLLAVASRPNWSYVRAKLREIDDDVSAAVLEALLRGADRASSATRRARAIERHRGPGGRGGPRGRHGPLHPAARAGEAGPPARGAGLASRPDAVAPQVDAAPRKATPSARSRRRWSRARARAGGDAAARAHHAVPGHAALHARRTARAAPSPRRGRPAARRGARHLAVGRDAAARDRPHGRVDAREEVRRAPALSVRAAPVTATARGAGAVAARRRDALRPRLRRGDELRVGIRGRRGAGGGGRAAGVVSVPRRSGRLSCSGTSRHHASAMHRVLAQPFQVAPRSARSARSWARRLHDLRP